MSPSNTWKDALRAQIPDDFAYQIDLFENQMMLRRQNAIDEKVFAETRLRRGVYGQRYDNGQRHDGRKTRQLNYPGGGLTKGPDTVWNAPGMQRIKVPYGGLTADQLETLAMLSEEYADDILHITTRQDIQFHYVHIDDTPDLMRRLAAVGLTTQEACGNSVRNVTGCPLAGVCRTEAFDLTPYADALTRFLLGHDDVQDFGRKFKIAFSGCAGEACGLVHMHDLGFLGRIETVDGNPQRVFDLFVGGGLGTVPHQAKALATSISEAEILPLAQATCRVFARLGEKRNRNRARLKFLVAGMGIEAFRRLVFAERETLPHDTRWSAFLSDLHAFDEAPLRPGIPLNAFVGPAGFREWHRTNVYQQRQAGYTTVTLNLPLGDLSAGQAFALAKIARRYVGDTIRTTVEQNIVLRWVSDVDLPDLFLELETLDLAAPGAETIHDITTCPGTDTCKLGIASSRGLTAELRRRLLEREKAIPPEISRLRIKVSGCFNSCGQHHIADIGFFGNSRRRNNRTVPHFQVVLGGQRHDNAGSYGLAVGAVPSKAAPAVLETIIDRYVTERFADETFQAWVNRLGKREIRKMLAPFQEVPTYSENAQFYSDWGDPREFTIGDMGTGECAGEVVSLFAIEIVKAEAEHFEALIALDDQDYRQADAHAYRAMLLAARALVRTQNIDVGDEPEHIVAEFRTRFFESKLFYDRYAKGKFARYLFKRHDTPNPTPDYDSAHQLVEETQLFIEAAHACDARLAGATPGGVQL